MNQMLETIGCHVLRQVVRLPKGLSERLAGPAPVNDRGTRLDHQTHMLIACLERLGQAGLDGLEPAEARRRYALSTRLFGGDGGGCEHIEDRAVATADAAIDVRIYRPSGGRALPICVYFHGGGFVVGDLDGYDGLCRTLAARSGCVVISVDYRLAPEHRFPAAVDDCVSLCRWVRANAGSLGVDARRLVVAGDSAGGNLATVVCQQLVDADQPTPAHQLLIYPATDNRGGYGSLKRFGQGFFLSADMVDWFSDTYTAGQDYADDPRVSPILYERLAALPPATVVTAGFDPLRDEGAAYAQRLDAAGVPVVHRNMGSLVHGFVTMGAVIDAAADAVDDIGDRLGRAVAP